MKFDIGTWWHWLFIAAATLASVYAACRVFSEEFAASHNPIVSPLFHFFYELAGSFAGWMALWKLLPFAMSCSGPECDFDVSFIDVLLGIVAVVGIFGQIPTVIDRSFSGLSRLVSRLAK